MNPEEKNFELKKYRNILLATIDYQLEKVAGSFIDDGFDPVADHYLNQKQKAEMDCLDGKLDKLKQEFQNITNSLVQRGDLNFDKYIKEKTGYETNIFEDLQLRVEQIIRQKEIKDQDQYKDVLALLSISEQISTEQKKIKVLNNLLDNFVDKRSNPVSLKISISEGKPPGIYSPDNKIWFNISESGTDKNSFLTSIAIGFKQASGGIYAVKGINLPISAYWKDNDTVVVETKRDYEVINKCKKVQSFNDIVTIEYIES